MCLLLVLLLCVLMSLPKGWAADIDPVYVALNDPVLLNIPGYPNAEKDQVTWKDGNGVLMGKFKNSSSYKQLTVCECELFRNGSLYLKRLDTVGNETYRVEVFDQSGKSITTASLLVTVIVPVSDPVLELSCESEERAVLTCRAPSGTDPVYSWTIYEGNIGHLTVNEDHLIFSLPFSVSVSCTARNDVSESTRRVSLPFVSCSVPVSDPVLEVSCLTNGSALVSCKVESGTNPFYSLIHNGKTVYENSSSPLVNVSLPLSSPGNISCSVRNRFSTKETGVQGRYCPVAGGVAVGHIVFKMAVFVLYSSLLGSMLLTLLRMRRDEGQQTIYINDIGNLQIRQ
ncbi:T-cell surface antigen CD2-like isoform X5 [Xenopus laevis]|uniref:T-cell surface antigen CD2-like isoform X5 n=1 Tax=Xenopus laevis TaxID=8355 RepID=A0A8J1M7K9_XENLA|nr:T-cell surface antigen CD2-like isoform X5 [Xenopus laevis]